MTPTIWQRGHLNVIDPTAFPVPYLEPSIDAGYAVVQVMLNPRHPDTSLDQVPLTYIRDIRLLGAKVFGFVWADDFRSPDALFDFVQLWRMKSLAASCAITGFVINAEDGWEAHDQAGEQWSKRFLTAFRGSSPTAKLSLALNTYNGCGGIDLPAWQARGARLYYQTFHEGNTHEWPMDGGVSWARYYGYTAKVSMKPNWSTYKGADGQLPQRVEQIKHAKWAGTVGFSAWYAEGAAPPEEHLIPLLREARAAGVCA